MSRPTLSACVNVLVATNDRFTWTESFLGTSPNGFSSFMWVLTQIRYLRRICQRVNNKKKQKVREDRVEKHRALLYLLVVEAELGVENAKHALVEGGEKVIHGLFEIDFAARVVVLEVAEQIGKHLAVLLVQYAVRPLEHVVKIALRVVQQLAEEFCLSVCTVRNENIKRLDGTFSSIDYS